MLRTVDNTEHRGTESQSYPPFQIVMKLCGFVSLCSFKFHQSQSYAAKVAFYAAQMQGYVAQMQGYAAVFYSSFSTMICSMFLSYAMDLPLII